MKDQSVQQLARVLAKQLLVTYRKDGLDDSSFFARLCIPDVDTASFDVGEDKADSELIRKRGMVEFFSTGKWREFGWKVEIDKPVVDEDLLMEFGLAESKSARKKQKVNPVEVDYEINRDWFKRFLKYIQCVPGRRIF